MKIENLTGRESMRYCTYDERIEAEDRAGALSRVSSSGVLQVKRAFEWIDYDTAFYVGLNPYTVHVPPECEHYFAEKACSCKTTEPAAKPEDLPRLSKELNHSLDTASAFTPGQRFDLGLFFRHLLAEVDRRIAANYFRTIDYIEQSKKALCNQMEIVARGQVVRLLEEGTIRSIAREVADERIGKAQVETRWSDPRHQLDSRGAVVVSEIAMSLRIVPGKEGE